MNYNLNEVEEMVKDLFSGYVDKRIIPMRRELDEMHDFPAEIFSEMAKQDFFRIFVPQQYGGMSDSVMLTVLGIEELARGDAGIAVSFAVDAIATKGITMYGTDEQKQKYLPGIASGEIMTAFALSEPGAGSDAASLKTRAEKRGNKYILNGVKQFITNGEIADVILVVVNTDPNKGYRGHTAFLIEKDSKGFSPGKREDKMGIRSSVTNELIFDDCEVPDSAILGKEGEGFYIALSLLDRSRIGIGAQAIGISRGAFEEALKYSKEREQFGKPISEFQAVSFMLADMATKIEASRSLVYNAARNVDAKEPDISMSGAMAKVFATDAAMKITTDAVQIFGGYGYMKEYPVEKMMRDAKVTQIYEGTNQIQRVVIASKILKGE